LPQGLNICGWANAGGKKGVTFLKMGTLKLFKFFKMHPRQLAPFVSLFPFILLLKSIK
jgi:hypothetical protein